MNLQSYPEVIKKFIQKLEEKSKSDHEKVIQPSYHQWRIKIGEECVNYNTQLQIKFKMNCQNDEFKVLNERFFQIQFKLKETLTEAQVKEQYSNFQKLIKQIVTVASLIDKEMRDLFKEFKLEACQGKSFFGVIIRLPQIYQQYWISFQDHLLNFFANIQKEEIVLINLQSDIRIKDLVSSEDQSSNIFYPLLKHSQIEIYSLLNKIISDENQLIIQQLTSQNLEEQKQNDLIMLLLNLIQSDAEINLDSFQEDELEQLGLFLFQFQPVSLNFQPAIIHKIKVFMKEVFSDQIKINMINSQTMCQIKLKTKDNLSQILDLFIMAPQSKNQ
ncbi:hypothetical protein TTHERM_00141120 (macronuclear) [Tetrahymena thermophila SB210]|uniref:Uncharacterized protein n=1 Tax=Tetrahymena thermophila (strain SB210) TaxID=312017 RepID=I7MDR4_TETTS|nr:hypothetical protein TTHERM_00141120 [Tetrahymena thermophila SB210]EAR90804.1 hypothetical protein TTHERM_00141120 [Tetrahymena thermophila SB210]|eukprot:XP_001011049.1 hypothetical protein TTHERM_00141120 [Tetrahymena thermophila SB210]